MRPQPDTKDLSRGERIILDAARVLETTDPRILAAYTDATFALARFAVENLLRRGLLMRPVGARN